MTQREFVWIEVSKHNVKKEKQTEKVMQTEWKLVEYFSVVSCFFCIGLQFDLYH